jgi:MbtH protein
MKRGGPVKFKAALLVSGVLLISAIILAGCAAETKTEINSDLAMDEARDNNPNQLGSSPDSIYIVMINQEEEFSIWPANRELPLGWNRYKSFVGNREIVLGYIKEIWTDQKSRNPLTRTDPVNLRCQVLYNPNGNPRYIMWTPDATSGFSLGYEKTGFTGQVVDCLEYVATH